MKAALCFGTPTLPLARVPSKTSVAPWKKPMSRPSQFLCPPIKASDPISTDTSTVDYTSQTSVFPVEACETIGGEACEVEMYPEVKLEPQEGKSTKKPTSEAVDREYIEYNSPKTVFPGEACDDLGGEFCEPEYQKDVFKEK